MIFGIDIDDTMTDTSSEIIKYARLYGTKEILHNLKDIVKGIFKNTLIKDFSYKYIGEIAQTVSLKPGTIEALRKLKANGHTIIIITLRSNELFPNAEEITLKYLKDNDIPYDKIIFGATDKLKECLENNVDLMIDDNIQIVQFLKANGINAVLMNSPTNYNVSAFVDRIDSLDQAEDYLLNIKGKKRKKV